MIPGVSAANVPAVGALTPPITQTRMIDLTLCSLHVMEAGEGPPLVMVPATLSELENWASLVQFMAQWFHVYFFELPGHGGSSAFKDAFTSDLVATTVAHLVDKIGADRFNLMGFSFGGILAMKTYTLLQERIDRLILLAPCLTHRALLLSALQRWAGGRLNALLKMASVRTFLVNAMQDPASRRRIAELVHVIGNVERHIPLEEKLARMRPSLVEIVSYELDEILTAEFPRPQQLHSTPCYFAMSVRDPLLDYQTTLDELKSHFAHSHVTSLSYPFHQPPRPFTFDELNESFRATVAEFMLGA